MIFDVTLGNVLLHVPHRHDRPARLSENQPATNSVPRVATAAPGARPVRLSDCREVAQRFQPPKVMES